MRYYLVLLYQSESPERSLWLIRGFLRQWNDRKLLRGNVTLNVRDVETCLLALGIVLLEIFGV